MADISTGHITSTDFEKITGAYLDAGGPETPFVIMKHLGGWGGILYVPMDGGSLQEDINRIQSEMSRFGFSHYIIEIMVEARRQQIPYVRFDTEGGPVEGAKTIEQ